MANGHLGMAHWEDTVILVICRPANIARPADQNYSILPLLMITDTTYSVYVHVGQQESPRLKDIKVIKLPVSANYVYGCVFVCVCVLCKYFSNVCLVTSW